MLISILCSNGDDESRIAQRASGFFVVGFSPFFPPFISNLFMLVVVMIAPAVIPPAAAAATAAVPRSNLDIVTQEDGTQQKSVPPKMSSIRRYLVYSRCYPVQSRSILVILP